MAPHWGVKKETERNRIAEVGGLGVKTMLGSQWHITIESNVCLGVA